MSRVVVVSGGGTGIGRAVAEAFAADGERVVLVGRRPEVLEATAAEITAAADGATPEVEAVAADLSTAAGADRVREVVGARAGGVDVLVNAAGGNVALGAPPAEGSPAERAAEHWTGNFRANVLTAVLLTEALRDLLAPGGRVLLLSSIAAYRGSGTGSYAGTKAALHPYAFDLAAALGPRGITVNVVAPGYVERTEFFRGALSAERERTLIGQTLNGRAGTPEDVAETVRWLASAGAAHVTGQIVQVNGGAERGR
ncbi:SDR family NAD(P)-dependent oxidoreductase [Allostreptomyces psammosilenae]|uniref:3-oxoacyl-[acyl-carrier protein] reductase n=1 Tax=Allostreptomyces psammosilenae TaxID=1892865 RepID=A0A853A8I5_9ACTN|nr:SDR family oxidoreductase [Allostreptomyces psammosilenae]NYI06951.1 3-oxoacyl-[acyl-carrier protein] reductase [Allostreptomyces psammosilenae]